MIEILARGAPAAECASYQLDQRPGGAVSATLVDTNGISYRLTGSDASKFQRGLARRSTREQQAYVQEVCLCLRGSYC